MLCGEGGGVSGGGGGGSGDGGVDCGVRHEKNHQNHNYHHHYFQHKKTPLPNTQMNKFFLITTAITKITYTTIPPSPSLP